MSAATAAVPAAPPPIDEGQPHGLAATLLEMLAPSAGRLRSSLLVLLPMCATLLVWEVFRLPQPAIAAFIVLMMARGDALSSIASSFATACAVSLSALIAVAVLSLSLSQPALRVPLTALMTFVTMMLVRGTTLGPVAFITGFFATYGTTQADNLLGLATSTGDVTNTEGFGRPQIDYFPPEEALLHSLLWLSLVVAIPALLLAVTERLFGADPRRLLLGQLRARLDAAAAFCRGEPGAADRVRGLARDGVAPILALVGVAERAGRTAALHDAHLRFARALNRLMLLLVAWEASEQQNGAAAGPGRATFLRAVAGITATLSARLRPGAASTPVPLPSLPEENGDRDLEGALPSLAAEIRVVVDRLRDAAAERDLVLRPGFAAAATGRRGSLLLPNAFGADNVRFALKVTLAVMVSYLIEMGLDWQAVGTCFVTCFFVALGTVGETVHKMTLRIAGAGIGGALGILAILLLMPSMTGFGQLLALFAPIAFLSAWIGLGSQRIAYAGWQILLAFNLTVLQGYGPTLDMQTARDRVIGILLGNVVITLVFVFVWPVRVEDAVRRDMAGAFELLGRMMRLPGGAAAAGERVEQEAALRDQFGAALARAGGVVPNDGFEPFRRHGGLGRGALTRLARLVVPVSVIAADRLPDAERDALPAAVRARSRAFDGAMADWFADAAAWVRTGADPQHLRDTLPGPPELEGSGSAQDHRVRGRAALDALLLQQARDFLDHALPATPEPGAPRVAV